MTVATPPPDTNGSKQENRNILRITQVRAKKILKSYFLFLASFWFFLFIEFLI